MMEEQRYQLRQEKSKPLLLGFKVWLDEIHPMLLPKSPLGKAVKYILKYWDGRIKYLDDGHLACDNNLTEQEIKLFVIARKNFLFADSVDGAKALCALLLCSERPLSMVLRLGRTLIVLDALPNCQSLEDYENFLPWIAHLIGCNSAGVS